MKRRFLRVLRISVLLFILFLVAANAMLTKIRTTDWDEQLWVVLYPIHGDGSESVNRYIKNLEAITFKPVADFFQEEGLLYNLTIKDPIAVYLAPPVETIPPKPPQGGNFLQVMWWSLKLRYWAHNNDTFDGPSNIKLYIVYHDPELSQTLDHSLGLEKGLIGVVNGFAKYSYEGRNNVVIAHELMHTLGASDKYAPNTGQPLYPDGYAHPERNPLHPQEMAEIMGGSIPLSPNEIEMPENLSETLVGPKTAEEINWR